MRLAIARRARLPDARMRRMAANCPGRRVMKRRSVSAAFAGSVALASNSLLYLRDS